MMLHLIYYHKIQNQDTLRYEQNVFLLLAAEQVNIGYNGEYFILHFTGDRENKSGDMF